MWVVRGLLFVAGLVTNGISFSSAQTAQSGAPRADDLPEHHKSKEGRLDPEELAAREKDQAKLAQNPVGAGPSDPGNPAMRIS